MIRTGKVIQAEGETLSVCFDSLQSCENCGLCGSRKDSVLVLIGKGNIGDMVEVEMPDAKVLKASMITYLVPLIGLIIGLAFGAFLNPANDLAILLFGIIGFVLTMIGVKAIDRRMGQNPRWQPRIVAVHENKNPKGSENRST
jgi:positive regulator of sigma E activity